MACKPKLRPSHAVNKYADNSALSSDSKSTLTQTSEAESFPSPSGVRLPPATPSRTRQLQPRENAADSPSSSRGDQTTRGEVYEPPAVNSHAPALPSRTARPHLNHDGNANSDKPSKRPAAALPSDAKVSVESAGNTSTLANGTSAPRVPLSHSASALPLLTLKSRTLPPVPMSNSTPSSPVPPVPPSRPRHQQMNKTPVTGAFRHYLAHVISMLIIFTDDTI